LTQALTTQYNPFSNEGMKGTITCQRCGRKRDIFKKVCSCGWDTVFIKIDHQGNRYRFFYDKQGQAYTVKKAISAQEEINQQIVNKAFDPKEWTPKGIEERKFINSFESFLNQKEKKLKPSTQYLYETYNRLHFTVFHELDVRDIKLKHLQTWYDGLPQSMSTKYKKNLTDCLRTFFRWLLRWGDIKEVPISPETEKVYTTPRTYIDYEAQIKALGRIPVEHRPIYEFLMESGFRPGETCALKINDLDYYNRRILVQRGYSKNVLVESPKEGKPKYRTLSSRAFEIVVDAIKNRLGDTFIFINPKTKKGYSTEFLRKMWREYSGSGVDLYSATRHSLASQLAAAGIPEKALQDIMGHADPRSTRAYTHFTEERKRSYLDSRSNVIQLSDRKKLDR